jgi:2,4-dienoyl-CoA reductase-like NADH-dependent reductase (Old Yellow Enzyme family)
LSYPLSRQAIRVGQVELRNRLFVPAHTTNFGVNHMPSERHVEYHRARARGGAGLIIFESIRVSRESLGRPQGVAGYERNSIPAFAKCAEAIHAEGARVFGQVIHLGRQIEGDWERTASFGPSAVRWSPTGMPPHVMNQDDMAAVIEAHVVTAKNVLEAGMDGFEVHLGHGHLLQQFLSPSSNVRTDAYGGSEENRLRFPIAVLKAVRAAVGAQATVGIRFSGDEFVPGGLALEDSLSMLPKIFSAVPLDFVNVSHSAYNMSYSLATQFADMHFDAAPFRRISREIRRALRANGHQQPVMAVGKYRSVAEAEEAIAGGVADMVGFARGHIADPDLVNKSFAGREAEVATCIGCNQGCAQMLEKNLAITCMVNATVGREADWVFPKSLPRKKRVVVIGGGPAGLEAAATAAVLGHSVTLIERAKEAGGQVLWMRRLPIRHDFLGLIAQQLSRCAREKVDLRFNMEATAQGVKVLKPDAVILATGSTPQRFELPMGGRALTVEEALAAPEKLGRRVAFHDLTGEFAALGAIEQLAKDGLEVTVFTAVAGFAWRTTIYSSLATRARLRDLKVRIATLRAVKGFAGGELAVEDTSTGEIERLPGFDSLVVAQYNAADDRLLMPLRAAGLEVKAVGDCLTPRTALEAVYEGHAAARAL